MIRAAYCGWPLSLGMAAKAMGLEVDKDTEGKRLISYFCGHVKPTKVNGGRLRNLPHHDPEKWEAFKSYCKTDVEVERAIDRRCGKYVIGQMERDMYVLDQEINDRGIGRVAPKCDLSAVLRIGQHKRDHTQNQEKRQAPRDACTVKWRQPDTLQPVCQARATGLRQ